jgi:beta-galactosidase
MPPDDKIKLQSGGRFVHWFEHLEGTAPVHLSTKSGRPAIMGGDHLRYLAGWPDDATFDSIIGGLCDVLDLPTHTLPAGLRIRDTATHRFVFNYAPKAQNWHGTIIPAAGVHWEPLG